MHTLSFCRMWSFIKENKNLQIDSIGIDESFDAGTKLNP